MTTRETSKHWRNGEHDSLVESDIDIAKSFCSSFANDTQIEGALLGGSARINTWQNAQSDIDVFIIGNDTYGKIVRGNAYCHDRLIEYFINPLWRIKQQMVNEIQRNHDYWAINIYASGIILFDSNGKVEELQREARAYFDTPFGPVDDNLARMYCRQTWESYTDCLRKWKLGYNYLPSYYSTVRNALIAHCYYSQLPIIPFNKCEQILTDDYYRRSYCIRELPEDAFCQLVLACMQVKDGQRDLDRITSITALYEYVAGVQGFDIDGFRYERTVSREALS